MHVVTLSRRADSDSASPGRTGNRADLSRELAEKVVDFALQSASPSLTFELQADGGEPLHNVEAVRHFVEYARLRNQRTAGKTLTFVVLSNLSAMSEDIAEWLIANDVALCTTLDGPASIHDLNREWKSGAPHAHVVRWIEYFHRRYGELGRDPRSCRVDALINVTRAMLGSWREIVDEYVARGLRVIRLRPLNPAAFAPETWNAIGYGSAEYLAFYRNAFDYILDLNRQGVEIVDYMALVFLSKILGAEDPGVVDIQSPCGDGTGQIAYDVDGRLFPCDEARVVADLGEPIFELGRVVGASISDVLQHPTVRAIAAASLLDAQPMCAECWNKPFCGVSPVYNFMTQGDLFAQRPHSMKCKEHMAIAGRLFELLGAENETSAILKDWVTANPSVAGRASKQAP